MGGANITKMVCPHLDKKTSSTLYLISDETHEYRMLLLQNLIVGQETRIEQSLSPRLFVWDTFKSKNYEKG